MSDKKISIAIDGPAGAGKSTIAKLYQRNWGFILGYRGYVQGSCTKSN